MAQRAAEIAAPSVQRLPAGCNREVFYAPETLLERRLLPYESWQGSREVPHYLVRWRGHPSAEECTWEPARAISLEARRSFDAMRGEPRAHDDPG